MFSLDYYLIVSFCILLFAISKSGFSGGGLALISVTVLSITYGPLTAIAILMPMLIVCDAIAAFLNRKYYEHSAVWSIAPFSLIGVIAGTILFKFINLSLISVFIGSISLTYVIFNYLLTKSKIKKTTAYYGSYRDKITYKWEGSLHSYSLLIKTRRDYGQNSETNAPFQIKYNITSLINP